MKYLSLVVALFVLGFTMAQENQDCACCSTPYQQFDFWIGDWNVYDTNGVLVGTNKIQSLEDKCVLAERWVGGQGTTGRSLNYYNAKDNTWNQVWVDNGGNPLALKGAWNGKSMVMKGALQQGQQIRSYRNVISWTPQSDGSVVQLWEIQSDDGRVLRTLFKGIYRPK